MVNSEQQTWSPNRPAPSSDVDAYRHDAHYRNIFDEFLSLVVEPDAPHENIPPDTREEFTRSYNSLVEEHGERAVFDTFLPIVSRAAAADSQNTTRTRTPSTPHCAL